MIHILMSQHGLYSPYTPHPITLEDHFLFRGSGRSLGRAQRADGEELYSFKPDIAHGGSFVYSDEEVGETDDFTGSRARHYFSMFTFCVTVQ